MFGKTLSEVRSRVFRVAVASSLVVIQGCQQLNEQLPEKRKAPPPKSLAVNVTSVKFVENVIRRHSSFGIIRPDKSSTLGFARGGQVTEVTVDVGAAVQKGGIIARLEQAQLQTQRDLVDRAVDSSRATLTNLENNPNAASLQQQIAQAKQRVARQETQRRDIDLELAKGTLLAPYDGIISERYVHVGDSIGNGRPVVRIVGNGSPTVELNLPTMIADRLQVGQSVSIGNGELEATVATKSAELDIASQTQRISCELSDDPPKRWALGDAVEVRFDVQSNRSGYWLPYSALQRRANGLWAAFVVVEADNQPIVERRTLTVELLEGERVLVRGALADGHDVIVDGLNRIVPGQRVTVSDGQIKSREAEPTTSNELDSAFPANDPGVGR